MYIFGKKAGRAFKNFGKKAGRGLNTFGKKVSHGVNTGMKSFEKNIAPVSSQILHGASTGLSLASIPLTMYNPALGASAYGLSQGLGRAGDAIDSASQVSRHLRKQNIHGLINDYEYYNPSQNRPVNSLERRQGNFTAY